jgi:hypothetical protein
MTRDCYDLAGYDSMMRIALLMMVLGARPAFADDGLDDLVGVTVTASSTLVEKGKPHEAWYVLSGDRDWNRFWCESKSDDGIGETLTFDFATPVKIGSVTIRAGVWKSDALFKANNIVTGITVTADGRKLDAKFPDNDQKEAKVAIGGAPVKQLALKIASVKKGKMNDSCITSVELDGAGELVVGATAAQAAALKPAVVEVNRALGACDDKSLKDHIAFPFSYKAWLGENEKGDSAYKTHTYKDAAAMTAPCKKPSRATFGSLPGAPSRLSALRVDIDGPGKVTLVDRDRTPSASWHYKLVAGSWKLASVDDQ